MSGAISLLMEVAIYCLSTYLLLFEAILVEVVNEGAITNFKLIGRVKLNTIFQIILNCYI